MPQYYFDAEKQLRVEYPEIDITRSSNPFVNGSTVYRYQSFAPLRPNCGQKGRRSAHSTTNCGDNPALEAWESRFLQLLMQAQRNEFYAANPNGLPPGQQRLPFPSRTPPPGNQQQQSPPQQQQQSNNQQSNHQSNVRIITIVSKPEEISEKEAQRSFMEQVVVSSANWNTRAIRTTEPDRTTEVNPVGTAGEPSRKRTHFEQPADKQREDTETMDNRRVKPLKERTANPDKTKPTKPINGMFSEPAPDVKQALKGMDMRIPLL